MDQASDPFKQLSSFFKGSGSLAAMAVFEDRYKPDMEVSNSWQYNPKSYKECDIPG